MLVFTSLVMLYSFIAPYQYEAETKLMPPSQSEGTTGLGSLLQGFTGSEIFMGNIGQNNQLMLFMGILKSRAVAKYIYDSLALNRHVFFENLPEEDVIDYITRNLTVQIDKSGILNVYFLLSSPWFSNLEYINETARLSAEIANTSFKALNHIIRTKNISKSKQIRLHIEKMLQDYKIRLDSIESELEAFKRKHKVISIDEQTQAILTQAVSVGVELTKAEIEYNIASQQYNTNSPQIKALQEAIQALQRQYQKVQQGGLIQQDVFSIPLENIPALERVYTSLIRDQKILNQVILYLETQRHQEAIQEEKDVPVVIQLDEAITPHKRVAPKRMLMLIISLFLSFSISTGVVIIRGIALGRIEYKKLSES